MTAAATMWIKLPKPAQDLDEAAAGGGDDGYSTSIPDGTTAYAVVSDNSSQEYEFNLVATAGTFNGSIDASGTIVTLAVTFDAGANRWRASFYDGTDTWLLSTPGGAGAFPATPGGPAFGNEIIWDWDSPTFPWYSMFS